VKYGDHRLIDDEYRNYERFVQPFVGGGRVASAQTPRRTLRLGGIVYSLLGGVGDRFEEFASFYRRSDAAAIRQALDRLFFGTCSAWYASLGQLKPLDLTQQYSDWLALTPDSLDEAVAGRLKTVQGNETLHFKSLTANRTLCNPILALRRERIVLPTYETVTHGDLSEHNILLDEEGHSWLIDFQKTGYGHVLRDVIQLDTLVRLHLLAPEEATLDERLGLEELLCSECSFSQISQPTPASLAPALDKAFATCAHLRTIAARLVASHPGADIREFYAGAMYCALRVLRSYAVPMPQREHAILCASVCAEHVFS
ncbi:MAG: phosphotransferase, partial [Acidobacteriota bacterium]|nr:phosphotransferase [Acidobacteriota bacterium]